MKTLVKKGMKLGEVVFTSKNIWYRRPLMHARSKTIQSAAYGPPMDHIRPFLRLNEEKMCMYEKRMKERTVLLSAFMLLPSVALRSTTPRNLKRRLKTNS